MDDLLHALLLGLKLGYVVGISGAIFFGAAALICKWLGWAPVNITVNVISDNADQVG